MKNDVMLTIASLLSILFMTFHHADDIAQDGFGRNYKHCGDVNSGSLAIWNANARRTAIRVTSLSLPRRSSRLVFQLFT